MIELSKEEKHIGDAVLQMVYIDEESGIPWIKGTCFIVAYGEKLFLITASHCIEDNYLKCLFLSKMSTERNLFSIPINCQIKSIDKRGVEVDTDLRVLKIDDKKAEDNIIKHTVIKSPKELEKEYFETPFRRLQRMYKNNPKKLLKKFFESKFYKTIHKKQEVEINKNIKNANTSLAEIKNLILVNRNFVYQKGKECQVYGYSVAKGRMDYNDKGEFEKANQVLIQVRGKLTGIYKDSSQTWEISYDYEGSLDGISGGPVITDGKVIGVASYISEKEKRLYFIPAKFIYMSIEHYQAETSQVTSNTGSML